MGSRPRIKDDIPWVPGMPLGPGACHSGPFLNRINNASRASGSGTVADPRVIWATPGPPLWRGNDQLLAIERIVREATANYGLSYAWIASDSHDQSTTSVVSGVRDFAKDDFHVTVRLGTAPNICNLHGHIYLIHANNDISEIAIRAMTDAERGVQYGRNPQFWVWGDYDFSDRRNIIFPKKPYRYITGSILEAWKAKNP